MFKFKKIPGNVLILGLVSFFNDFASEMIYPIIPIFLTTVLHTSVPIIGLIEGFAEATASIAKYIFGAYSDYIGKRKIFVTGGYSFSTVSKLLIGLSYAWPLVLFARFIDRLGKGLRTAARDSLLLENTDTANRGYIFGFHRAFDSLGAVVGPLAALVLLTTLHENIRLTFFLAVIPSVIAVLLLIFLVKEKKAISNRPKPKLFQFRWRTLDTKLKLFLGISFIFALGNSSNTFLLLRGSNLGLSVTLVVATYVLYNITQTLLATPLGILADKIGARKVFAGGLLVFSAVYFAFGFITNPIFLFLLFPLYGIYIAATDGVSTAYVSSFITQEVSGTYFGAYYSITAIGNFLASLIGGLLWITVSPSSTFYFGAITALLAFLTLLLFKNRIESGNEK